MCHIISWIPEWTFSGKVIGLNPYSAALCRMNCFVCLGGPNACVARQRKVSTREVADGLTR